MLKYQLLTFIFAIKNLFIPTIHEKRQSDFKVARNGYSIHKVGHLPDSVPESSGLEIAKEGKTFWTHGDGHCSTNLFEITREGHVQSVFNLKGVGNFDWEELTKDKDGNIYVGDFGNNYNKRKDLVIYKVNPSSSSSIESIKFTYEDQKDFPPAQAEMNFDCEAMVWYKDSIYLFSKNRGQKWMKIYSLPDKPGTHTAKIHQKIYLNSMVTAADISPDLTTVALLTYGKIYFLKVNDGFNLDPLFVKVFNRSKQSEGLVFYNDTDLLISNEQGELFEARKKKRK
jgi:hypothetical protein